MRKILIVVDMQKDFIDGSLGTKEAEAIVRPVIDKIKSYRREDIFATRDTHQKDYLDTQEGKNLPVEHCIEGTEGWMIDPQIEELILPDHIFDKPTFGSAALAAKISEISSSEDIEVELVGLCTDICVISNALLLKAYMPEVRISVDSSCCAGVTPEKHEAALLTMGSCQIHVQ
ncbi:MAG: cysteine hydrolase [Lachnospiraceae bacterium]|nr:cysteine hydrolase [Lachnospiraceae bacterium]